MGASKGGTAALFHGLNGNYKNIVVSAPRIHPARGNIKNRPKIVEQLVGSSHHDELVKFDNIIPDLIKSSNKDKNIYLFTSKKDEQYSTDIQHNIPLLQEYENFNLIETDSPSVNQHEDITIYNVQPIIAIVGLLTDGLTPRLDEIANGYYSRNKNVADSNSVQFEQIPINLVDKIDLSEDGFWISGRSFIRGIDASDYKSVRRFLKLEQSGISHEFYLGGLKDRRNNRDYFDHDSLDYSAGAYAPHRNKSINLDTIEFGTFNLRMEIRAGGESATTDLFEVRPTRLIRAIENYIISVTSVDNRIILTKMPIHITSRIDGQFKLDDWWIKRNTIHLSGRYSLSNVNVSSWSDINYQLLIISEKDRKVAASLTLAKFSRDASSVSWRDDSKSNFTTLKHKGIKLPPLSPGKYRLAIVGDFRGYVHSIDTSLELIYGNTDGDHKMSKR